MKELGERLRRLRESVKLSQVKMAELLGVKQSSINRYEQGQSAPSLETLVRYADYFDVSLDDLVGRDWKPKKDHKGRNIAIKPQPKMHIRQETETE